MIQYQAGYKSVEGEVHAQVLDFQEAISCGSNLEDARRNLESALLDVAETRMERGEALPRPNPSVADPEMDLQEPIYLYLSASSVRSAGPTGVVVS